MDASHPPLESDHPTNYKLDPEAGSEYEGNPSPLPVFYKFRYTFSDQDNELNCLQDNQFMGKTKTIYRAFINRMSENGYFFMDRFTAGYETKNKSGEPCKAHFHLHFQSHATREALIKCLRRLATEWDQDFKSNKSYSLRPDGMVREVEAFFRYPLKQYPHPDPHNTTTRGFNPERIVIMHAVAHESWLKACQINSAKQDNRDTPDTLFLSVLRIIQKNNDTTKRSIAKTFYKYYEEENKPINHTVIEGYVLNAMLKQKLLTIDELLDAKGY